MLYKRFYFLILFFLFFGCGRKQKNIYNFSDKTKKIKINNLSLPAVQNLSLKKISLGILVLWNPLEKENIKLKEGEAHLLGYDIFKFKKSGFISKKPINKFICTKNNFVDQNFEESFYYLVRAVFKIQGQIIYSPSSQIISLFDY